ncbi:Protein of unknown function [Bacillus wiedmannii]
MKALD